MLGFPVTLHILHGIVKCNIFLILCAPLNGLKIISLYFIIKYNFREHVGIVYAKTYDRRDERKYCHFGVWKLSHVEV